MQTDDATPRHVTSRTRPCPLCTGTARAEEHRDAISELSDAALMAMAEAIADILRQREQSLPDAGEIWSVQGRPGFPWADDEVGVEQ